MRIVHWNIQHGGGPNRTPEIALTLLELDADVAILTEFRRTTGGQIAGVLHDHGLCHQLSTNPPPRTNGILIASRTPLRPVERPDDPDIARRSLGAIETASATRISAVHLPDAARGDHRALARKAAHWHALLAAAERHAGERHLVIGDLNTGRHRLDEAGSTFTCTALMGRLSALGYADAYRRTTPNGRDLSWKSHAGAGFRLDGAFVSAALAPAVKTVEYTQKPRKNRVSDHAPMCVELAPDPPASGAKTKIA